MRVSTREPDAAWRRREEDREIGTSSSWIGGIVAAIAIGTWLAGLVPSERFWAYADSFKFVVSSPMLASRWAPVVATATYLATLYSLKRFVATRGKPFDLMPVRLMRPTAVFVEFWAACLGCDFAQCCLVGGVGDLARRLADRIIASHRRVVAL